MESPVTDDRAIEKDLPLFALFWTRGDHGTIEAIL